MGAALKIQTLGLRLPAFSSPVANYVSAVRTGNLLYLSGVGPVTFEGTLVTGRVGDEIGANEAKDAARLVGLQILATLQHELGSLDRVRKIVKILGMVNCAPNFTEMPLVLDGCSDLLVEVFGREIGAHARSAVGVSELPFHLCLEVELIAEIG